MYKFHRNLTTKCLLVAAFGLFSANGSEGQTNGYELVFADEFNLGVVDEMKWNYNYTWGNYHNHNAVMSKSQVSVNPNKGALEINAVYGTPDWAKDTQKHDGNTYSIDFTSGAIQTKNKFEVQYGYIEARMRMPDTRGSWPAFWTLQEGWPPEIDIMEFPLSSNDQKWRYWWNYHYGNSWQDRQSFGNQHWQGSDLTNSWHTYGVKWEEDQLKFYFDGTAVATITNSSALSHLDAANYLILNYAVGGWPGYPPNASQFDDLFEVDWVRVWQQAESKDTRLIDVQGNGYAEWDWEGNWTDGSTNQAKQTARFGTQGSATQQLEWSGLKSVGRVYFDGDTAFTLGDGDESLMLAMGNPWGWSRIWSDDGTGEHTINARIDMWSNLSVVNSTEGDLTFNADVISQANDNGGGKLSIGGGSRIIFNSNLHVHSDVLIDEQTHVVLNEKLYASDVLYDNAKLTVSDGAILEIDGLNAMQNAEGELDQSLGYLGVGNDRLVLDDGTIVLRGSTASYRGFTIGSGGATLIAGAESDVWLRQSSVESKQILSEAGGTLTLGGEGNARFDKVLSGDGNLVKTGIGTWTLERDNEYAGTTTVKEGHLQVLGSTGAGDVFVWSTATLSGTGEIAGDLIANGTISPGNSPGSLTVANSTLSSLSTLEIEIGGLDNHDKLVVLDDLILEGGDLDLQLLGYAPQIGDQFDVLDFQSISGTFGDITTPELTAGLFWDTSNLYTDGTIGVVPEPSALVVILISGFVAIRRRRSILE